MHPQIYSFQPQSEAGKHLRSALAILDIAGKRSVGVDAMAVATGLGTDGLVNTVKALEGAGLVQARDFGGKHAHYRIDDSNPLLAEVLPDWGCDVALTFLSDVAASGNTGLVVKTAPHVAFRDILDRSGYIDIKQAGVVDLFMATITEKGLKALDVFAALHEEPAAVLKAA
jgi:hypothetical protein